VRLYDDALRNAQRCRDEVSSKLFADLLADEQAHLKELDRMLAELAEKEKKHG
jgi:bacterioferritin